MAHAETHDGFMTQAGRGAPTLSRWAGLYRWALPVYWVALFVATHLPKVSLGRRAPENADKVIHFTVYGLLAFLWWRHVQVRRGRVDELFPWIAVVVIAVYAVADEILQELVGRSFEFYDWLADVCGAVAVLTVMGWRRRAAAPRDRASSAPKAAGSDGG